MKRLRVFVINYLTRHLLRAVTEDEILTITSEGYMLNKHRLDKGEILQLREDARALKSSLLWKLVNREVEYVAFLQMRKATSEKDTIFSHAMYYNLDLIRKFINNLS